jgi:hypothetical protein
MMGDEITVANLLEKIQHGWDELNAFLDSLTVEQKTVPTDAGGWKVKDHVIHMAVWEDGIEALLNKLPRSERMGIDEETRQSRDINRINDVIYKRHKDDSLESIMGQRQQIHERLISTIKKLTDDDLNLQYRHFSPDSKSETPILGWIAASSFAHYEEHIPWMRAIADKV